MERLKQIFSPTFDVQNLALTETQRDVVLTVWSEHYGYAKPLRVCKGQFIEMLLQLQTEYKKFLVKKIEVVEPIPPLIIKKTKKNKK